MNRIALVVAAALVFPACKKDSAPEPVPAAAPKAAEPVKVEPPKPSGTAVASFPLTVELPANAVANDPSGAPGFHSEDGSISVQVSKDEAPKDLEASKKSVEEFAFKKWAKAEKTADGYLLTWVGVGIDLDGKEFENFPFEVQKKIGDTVWRCSGSVKQAAQVDANLTVCNSLKAAPAN